MTKRRLTELIESVAHSYQLRVIEVACLRLSRPNLKWFDRSGVLRKLTRLKEHWRSQWHTKENLLTGPPGRDLFMVTQASWWERALLGLDHSQEWQPFARRYHYTAWLLDCNGEHIGVLNKQLRVDWDDDFCG